MKRILPQHCSLAALTLLALGLAGCAAQDYPQVPIEKIQQVKSGTALAEIEQLLGKSHEPTSAQAKALMETLDRMPTELRTNALADRSLAWGNDQAFLVAKVNSQSIVWVTAWRTGSQPTNSPPNP